MSSLYNPQIARRTIFGSMKPMVVIGLGNILLADEGVGIMLLRALSHRSHEFPSADFIELGTGGMSVVHAMAGRRKAVVLDCARMGASPGTIRRFTPEAARSANAPGSFSMHQGDILELIAVSRVIGALPEKIVIFGIEPESLATGEKLSPSLQSRIPDYLAAISEELLQDAGPVRGS